MTSGRTGDARTIRGWRARPRGPSCGSVGINTDLAPVLDVPRHPGRRDRVPVVRRAAPRRSRGWGLAFAERARAGEGAGDRQALPRPGSLAAQHRLLAQARSTHRARSSARTSTPSGTAIEQGIPLVMVGSAAYPALGAEGPGRAASRRSLRGCCATSWASRGSRSPTTSRRAPSPPRWTPAEAAEQRGAAPGSTCCCSQPTRRPRSTSGSRGRWPLGEAGSRAGAGVLRAGGRAARGPGARRSVRC